MAEVTVEELKDMREPIRRLCAERFDRGRVRETGVPQALDRDAWRTLAEIGVLGALDLGMCVTAELIEECGQGLAPGPLVWGCLASTVLDGVASGDVLVTGFAGGGRLVEYGLEADRIVRLTDAGIELHEPAGLEAVASVDPCVSLARFTGTGAPATIGDRAMADRWRLTGTCLTAAYLVGASRLALGTAIAHANERVQFGRPIAGFQAVKHLLADVLVAIELAAAAVTDAAMTLDGLDTDAAGTGEAARACSSAKVLASQAGAIASKHCIQIHGGMGYAWESDPHLIWKRTMVYGKAFGTADEHALEIAEAL